jgi:hypothetical protein
MIDTAAVSATPTVGVVRDTVARAQSVVVTAPSF